jgi:uncharacterized RDD family membrane protein YckC
VSTTEPPRPPASEPYVPPADAVDVPFRETAPIDPARGPVVHGTIVESAAPASVPAKPLRVFGNPVSYVMRRFAASTIDLVLASFVVTWLLYGIIAVNPLTGLPTNTEGGFDSTFAMGIGIALLYVFLAEAIFGTTLGKLALGLHVYPTKGNFVGLARSFIRSLLRPVDLLVVGAFLALAPGHRRLGDLFGGTVVAQSPLRGVAPIVGWIGIVAVAALPFVFDGGLRFFIVLAAFAQFVPHLISGAIAALGGLLASLHG